MFHLGRFTRGTMRKGTSDVAVEVDGMPRHVRNLRYRMETFSDDNDLMVNVNFPTSLTDDNFDLTLDRLLRKHAQHLVGSYPEGVSM